MRAGSIRASGPLGFVLLVGFLATASVRDAGASWPADPETPLVIRPVGSNAVYSEVATDGVGGAYIAWGESNGGATSVIRAQHVDTGGTLTWGASGLAIWPPATGSDSYSVVRCVPCADGGVIVVASYSTSVAPYPVDLIVQRFSPNGVARWGTSGVHLSVVGSTSPHARAAADGANGVLLAWEGTTNGQNQVFAQHLDSTGATRWTVPGAKVCNASGTQANASICSDGALGAVVSWGYWSAPGTNSKVYVQHVNAGGASTWGSNGVPACLSTTKDGSGGVLVGSGDGGAMVAWTDRRAGTGADIYAQRFSPVGARAWGSDGLLVCAVLGDQNMQDAIPDGSGGMICVWSDTRGGYPLYKDLYAQRLNGAGASLWDAFGAAIIQAFNDQDECAVAADGFGGFYANWLDSRLEDVYYSDMPYGQWMDGTGVRSWDYWGVPICASQADKYTQRFDPGVVPSGYGNAIVTWSLGGGLFAQIIRTDVTAVTSGPAPSQGPACVEPNPVVSTARVRFSLAEAASVRLDLLDVSGRRVVHVASGDYSAGVHVMDLRAVGDDGAALSPGIYYLRFASGKTASTRKVAVVR
jgi:hypothetical protein